MFSRRRTQGEVHAAVIRTARRWLRRQEPGAELSDHSHANRGLKIVGAMLALIVLALMSIAVIGERYGTRAGSPGHWGKPIVCTEYQAICF